MKNDRERIADLVQQFKGGNTKAFDELYNLTNKNAYFVALQIVKDEHLAQDILQESYVKAIDKIQNLENPESFVRWFHQIVTNRSMDYLRKRSPVLFEDGEDGAFEVIPDEKSEFSPEKNVDQEELRSTVMEAMDELTNEKRACVLMMYFEDMSVNEISESLNVPVSTVKNRLWTARKELKTKFERIGITTAYSAAPMGVVAWALGKTAEAVSQTFSGNPEAIKIISGISVAGTAAAASGAAASSAAAGTSVAAKAAALTTIQKIAAGIAIAGVVTGSTVGITSFVKKHKTEEPTASYSEQLMETTTAAHDIIEEEELIPVQVVDKNEEKAERDPVVLKNIRNSPSLKLKYMGEVREGVNIIDVTEDEESLFYCYFRAEKPGYYAFSFRNGEKMEHIATYAINAELMEKGENGICEYISTGGYNEDYWDCKSITLCYLEEGDWYIPIHSDGSTPTADLLIEYCGKEITDVEFLDNALNNRIIGYNMNTPTTTTFGNYYVNLFDINVVFDTGKKLKMEQACLDYELEGEEPKIGENNAVFEFPNKDVEKTVVVHQPTDYVSNIEIEELDEFLKFEMNENGFEINNPDEYNVIVTYPDGSKETFKGSEWNNEIVLEDGTILTVEFTQPKLTDREAVQFIVVIGEQEYIREYCQLTGIDPFGFGKRMAVFIINKHKSNGYFIDLAVDNLFHNTESFEDFIRFSGEFGYLITIGKLKSMTGTLGYGLDLFLTMTEILEHNVIV
ncbi:MAG: RNA polymerase sigma factor [Clostridia bacterium]|nr:RNA polymerase sigma factor [Clostridia bacterium]